MRGCQSVQGEVLVIFDSHMEVNIDWLQPLLNAIAKDRKIVAMASLDYINKDTLEYTFYKDHIIRYGWSWSLCFYEENFRWDQIGPYPRNPRNGVTMVGTGFAIDKKFFFDIGGFDEAMMIWGGENLELSWRIWMCGGRVLHIPCSNIGHVARSQPYSFPIGRKQTEHFNYKRAILVWMGDYSKYVYNIHPDMKKLEAGDLTDRLTLKAKFECKDFTWYIKNIWPELTIFDEDVIAWGRGFALTNDHSLRASLQCVICADPPLCSKVQMMGCLSQIKDKWDYTEYLEYFTTVFGVAYFTTVFGVFHKSIWSSAQQYLEYFTTVFGVLHNSIWSTLQQYLEYLATVFGVLHNSIWSTSQQYLEYFTTVFGVLRNSIWSTSHSIWSTSQHYLEYLTTVFGVLCNSIWST
ncbi:Polypeptide N-acetylgalactosaminyltransferase 3 [Bulinus truncatus]|nr:Polypeptide N-acetylgalactosaminyltransferase 3 [Bulinus truncatus]